MSKEGSGDKKNLLDEIRKGKALKDATARQLADKKNVAGGGDPFSALKEGLGKKFGSNRDSVDSTDSTGSWDEDVPAKAPTKSTTTTTTTSAKSTTPASSSSTSTKPAPVRVSTASKPVDVRASTASKPVDVRASTTAKPVDVRASTASKPVDVRASTTAKPVASTTTSSTSTKRKSAEFPPPPPPPMTTNKRDSGKRKSDDFEMPPPPPLSPRWSTSSVSTSSSKPVAPAARPVSTASSKPVAPAARPVSTASTASTASTRPVSTATSSSSSKPAPVVSSSSKRESSRVEPETIAWLKAHFKDESVMEVAKEHAATDYNAIFGGKNFQEAIASAVLRANEELLKGIEELIQLFKRVNTSLILRTQRGRTRAFTKIT